MDSVTERIRCSGHPTLHSRDDARAQFSRRNDRADRTYLPTRTFELAVHELDIARAAAIPYALPIEVLREATILAARTAVATGQGEKVLLSLTDRITLPSSFCVV